MIFIVYLFYILKSISSNIIIQPYQWEQHLSISDTAQLLVCSASLCMNLHFCQKNTSHSHYLYILSSLWNYYFKSGNITIFRCRFTWGHHVKGTIYILKQLQLNIGSQGVSIAFIFLIDFVVRWLRDVLSYLFTSDQSSLLYILSAIFIIIQLSNIYYILKLTNVLVIYNHFLFAKSAIRLFA